MNMSLPLLAVSYSLNNVRSVFFSDQLNLNLQVGLTRVLSPSNSHFIPRLCDPDGQQLGGRGCGQLPRVQ